jgi:hypothetical protein
MHQAKGACIHVGEYYKFLYKEKGEENNKSWDQMVSKMKDKSAKLINFGLILV